MTAQDVEVLKVARAIQPHLGNLIGEDAGSVELELAKLVREGELGVSVRARILVLLAERDSTREWARSLLSVPADERAFEPLPGQPQEVTVFRYGCPEGDQVPWFRFDARDDIPVCPIHDLRYVLQQGESC
ncbi:hypothetical protein ACRYCC_31395 [Actinomadura scrupuli]|uniref:hypothetical protein n=1 Tax=Actinomadura scrupuli TaxID=559629 RepID=UPI003D99097A